jgi:hypothetical protein
LLVLVVTSTFAVAMPWLVGLLSPREVILVPVPLIVLLGVYQAIRVWSDTFAMVLQSISDLRPLWRLVPVQALLSLLLQLALAPRYGLYGIVSALIGSFLLTVAWGLPLAVWRQVRATNEAGA